MSARRTVGTTAGASLLAFLRQSSPKGSSALLASTPVARKRLKGCRPTQQSSLYSTGGNTEPSDISFLDLELKNWQLATDVYDDGFGPLTCQAVPRLLKGCGFPPCRPPSENVHHHRFLDVATGPGYVLSSAISIASNSASGSASAFDYSALDFSSNFLELASARVQSVHPGVNVQFIKGDATSMPLDDNDFDSVACNFGILHLDDPDKFLRESHRVLRPEGRLAFSAWAPPPLTEGMDLILQSVSEAGNPDVALPEGPPFFRFGDADECKLSMEKAGFVDVEVTVVDGMKWDNVKSSEQLYKIFLNGTARTRELLKGQTADETERVLKELDRRFKEVTGRGKTALKMPAVVTSGMKPS
mmetsp:Transcript_18424/g.53125  ORF Transcript_18424/g.53125 Transcript_18424/m.53125 type:complete len:359 (-) Transcript_18424:91-1167(-)